MVRTGEVDPTPTDTQRRPARRRRPLHLRRRPQPDGRRAGQGQPVARGHEPGQAAVLPRPPHQGRQRPARHHPRAAADGIPDAAYTALTGDDKADRHGVEEAQRRRAARPGRTTSARRRRRRRRHHAQRAGDRRRSPSARPRPPPLADVAWAAQRYADPAGRRRDRPRTGWSPTPGAPPSSAPKTADDDADHHRHARRRSPTAPRPTTVVDAVDAIAARHRLFHWHLEFPEIFRVPDDGPADDANGWTGGFDAVLGNPPWERVKLQEQEFFATRDPEIADAKNAAARKKAIAALDDSEPRAVRRVQRRQAPVRGREPVPAHAAAATRSAASATSTPTASSPSTSARRLRRQRAQRHHHPDRPRHRRHDRRLLRRHARSASGWPRSTTSRTRPRSSLECTTRSASRCRS